MLNLVSLAKTRPQDRINLSDVKPVFGGLANHLQMFCRCDPERIYVEGEAYKIKWRCRSMRHYLMHQYQQSLCSYG